MPFLSMFKKAKKEDNAVKADTPPPKPYKHVPQHAAIDAMSQAPATWRGDDRERIKQEHRRRSASIVRNNSDLSMGGSTYLSPVERAQWMHRSSSSQSVSRYSMSYTPSNASVMTAQSSSSGAAYFGGDLSKTVPPIPDKFYGKQPAQRPHVNPHHSLPGSFIAKRSPLVNEESLNNHHEHSDPGSSNSSSSSNSPLEMRHSNAQTGPRPYFSHRHSMTRTPSRTSHPSDAADSGVATSLTPGQADTLSQVTSTNTVKAPVFPHKAAVTVVQHKMETPKATKRRTWLGLKRQSIAAA